MKNTTHVRHDIERVLARAELHVNRPREFVLAAATTCPVLSARTSTFGSGLLINDTITTLPSTCPMSERFAVAAPLVVVVADACVTPPPEHALAQRTSTAMQPPNGHLVTTRVCPEAVFFPRLDSLTNCCVAGESTAPTAPERPQTTPGALHT